MVQPKKDNRKAPRKKKVRGRKGGIIQANKQNVKVTISLPRERGDRSSGGSGSSNFLTKSVSKRGSEGGFTPSLPNISYSYPQFMISPGNQIADTNRNTIAPIQEPRVLASSIAASVPVNPQTPAMQVADPTENTDTLNPAQLSEINRYLREAMSQPPPMSRILRTNSSDSEISEITHTSLDNKPFSPPGQTYPEIYEDSSYYKDTNPMHNDDPQRDPETGRRINKDGTLRKVRSDSGRPRTTNNF